MTTFFYWNRVNVVETFSALLEKFQRAVAEAVQNIRVN